MACTSVEANPAPINNWNHSVVTKPAVVVRAKTVDDVRAAVRGDGARFPSPVLAVGSAHTVTDALRNDGGTMVDVSALNAILGFDKVDGKDVVRVQCGVKLADLHRWLDERGKEISFSPEIGDATVGSIVGSTTKDSSLDGPGFFSALVASATWVDETGQLRTASLEKDPQVLAQVTCAYGLMGIIVEAALLVRTHSVCSTVMSYHPCARTADGSAAVAILSKQRSECDNMFVIMHPCRDQIYTEQRWLVKGTTRVAPLVSPVKLFLVGTPKSYYFQRGRPLNAVFAGTMALNRFLKLRVFHRRYRFTNSYRPVLNTEDRLDFSYFEFDVSRFEQVVKGCWEFAADYERRTGFVPNGFAAYFVQRPGTRLAGSYTGAKGTSFMLDPVHNDPTSAEWHHFNEAYTRWAVAHGANVSLTQTKAMGEGPSLGGALPQSLARERFVTPFFKPFIVSETMFKAQASYARPLGDEHPRKRELLARVEELVMEAEARADPAAVQRARKAQREASRGVNGGLAARASRLLSNFGLLSTMEASSNGAGDSDSEDGRLAPPSKAKSA